jgi:hypothetical protein
MTMNATETVISRDWVLWISENLLHGCMPTSMLQTMTAAGLDPIAASQALEEINAGPVMQAARRHQQMTRKLESVMLNQCRLQQFSPSFSVVERRKGLSKKELFEDYFLANRPVIVTDMAEHWPALQKWSPQYLKARFGDVEVEVQHGRSTDKNYEQNKLALRKKMPLGAFVDLIDTYGSSNDLYMTANNEALKSGPLASLLDDIGPLPDYMPRENLIQNTFLWFGPAGTVTPLHHDTVHLFHLQVMGRKRWRFISPMQTPLVYNFNQVFSQVDLEAPDLARFPLFAQAAIIDAVVEPGEALFLPLAWWHHVRSLDTCISLSFSNLRLPGTFEFQNPSNPHW